MHIPRRRTPALIGLLLMSAGCSTDATSPPVSSDLAVTVTRVASGFDQPVHVASMPGDERLFVVERSGVIRSVREGVSDRDAWLDIRNRVSSGGERGLLSVAFSPNFQSDKSIYVNFTGLAGETRIERIRIGADGVAAPGTAELVLSIPQPASNHNGGMIQFGPDGYLWIGMGDGGGANDQFGNGQDTSTLLGSMLRIDVIGRAGYAIPPDNPYLGTPGARPEAWAIGLRNPWRFSFDEAAGLLYIADVGQNQVEELNAVPSAEPGLNYGWNLMEGSQCFPSGEACDRSGLTLPAVEYTHAEGCSVTGGLVYRGTAIPNLVGHYVYADFCAGMLRSFRLEDGSVTDQTVWDDLGSFGNITSFGHGPHGEIYFVTLDGTLYRIDPVEQ